VAAKYGRICSACADTGVQEGEIPMFTDLMIAKLIVYGKDRLDAIAKTREALNGSRIRRYQQQRFHSRRRCWRNPKFVAVTSTPGSLSSTMLRRFAEDVRMISMLTFWWRRSSRAPQVRERAAALWQLPGYGAEGGARLSD
jgi:propionyl-CoA carboxylase alpha chain